jgi:hypothetical protein
MKESYGKGLAAHTGPESCGDAREGVVEALTGVRQAGYSAAKANSLRDADAVGEGGRQHPLRRHRQAQRNPARS